MYVILLYVLCGIKFERVAAAVAHPFHPFKKFHHSLYLYLVVCECVLILCSYHFLAILFPFNCLLLEHHKRFCNAKVSLFAWNFVDYYLIYIRVCVWVWVCYVSMYSNITNIIMVCAMCMSVAEIGPFKQKKSNKWSKNVYRPNDFCSVNVDLMWWE